MIIVLICLVLGLNGTVNESRSSFKCPDWSNVANSVDFVTFWFIECQLTAAWAAWARRKKRWNRRKLNDKSFLTKFLQFIGSLLAFYARVLHEIRPYLPGVGVLRVVGVLRGVGIGVLRRFRKVGAIRGVLHVLREIRPYLPGVLRGVLRGVLGNANNLFNLVNVLRGVLRGVGILRKFLKVGAIYGVLRRVVLRGVLRRNANLFNLLLAFIGLIFCAFCNFFNLTESLYVAGILRGVLRLMALYVAGIHPQIPKFTQFR